MSNNKTYIKQFVSKPKKEKYESFNQFLYNIYQYIPAGNSPVQTEQNLNQNLLIKYTKLNGSKNIILSNMNSLPIKDNINQNFDVVKSIKENLNFISANSKYINNIQKLNYKPNNNFLFDNSFFTSINNKYKIFNTNKNILDENKNNDLKNENINQNLNLITQEINESNITRNKFNSSINSPKKNIYTNPLSQGIYRQDYFIKQFKVQYSIWLRNILNTKLISFLEKIKMNKKSIKFYPLNSLQFTANPKYKDNKIFLAMKIKEILTIGINGNKNSNQKKNKENIEFIEKIGQENNINDDLIEFLNLTMAESLNIFNKSEQFIKFKNSEQAKINDEKFFKEKKFSLLENNGFIFLFTNFNGNSKYEI